jgi:dolichol-phosphate mannosyltransferase
MINNLWVVMPVYNEEESITAVINEWLSELRKHHLNFTLCILNDGSKDKTLNIINELAKKEKELYIVDKPNNGHGQTCVEGYRLALSKGADWVFQIDSDGQCESAYFIDFIPLTNNNSVIYGFRKTRDDGFKRYLISRVVSLFSFVATGVWVRDANVPYRLMNAESLKDVVNKVPRDFYLANIYVSVLQQKHTGIKWHDIHFRNRIGGVASVKTFSFAKHGIKLFKQLRAAVK